MREGQDLKSPQTTERLSHGAIIEELNKVGERLQYRLQTGTGPAEGWISLKVSGKEIVVPKVEAQSAADWPELRASILKGAPLPTNMKEAGAWVKLEPPTKKVAQARLRLVIFDWTGNRGGAGAMNNFKTWEKVLGESSPADTWEVCKVYYPGRSMRMKEPNARTAAEVATGVVDALSKAGPAAGTVLFGFSFGAILAYETAALLASKGIPLAGLVVASAEHPTWAGRAMGPSDGPTKDMSEGAFEDMLRSKGGTDVILNGAEEMKKMLLPVIRADMAMEECYGAEPPALEPLPCPIVAFRGKGCKQVAREDVEPWLRCSGCGEGTPSRVEELEAGLTPMAQAPWLSDWYLCQGDASSLAIVKAIAQDFGTAS